MDWLWESDQKTVEAPMSKGGTLDSKPELRLTVRFEDGDEREFQIPAFGGGLCGIPFQWNIDWGDGARGHASGATSARGGDVFSGDLVHKYEASGTYEILLSPAGRVSETTGDEPGWLQAFGYPDSRSYRTGGYSSILPKGGDVLVEVDGVLDDRAINTELDGACSVMFANCKNITMGPAFTFSSNKTRTGDFFCFGMFEMCKGSAFTMGESFRLPQNLRTVGRAFCCKMFQCCDGASFTMNDVFTIPQGIVSAGSNFCQDMFGWHGLSLTMGRAFNLPQGLVEAEDDFCSGMFNVFGGQDYLFEMNEIFNLPQHISGHVGKGFCSGMFRGTHGPNFTMNDRFNLPNGITSAGDSFCEQMFLGCAGARFSVNNVFNLPERLERAGTGCCSGMFALCDGSGFQLNEKFDYPAGLTTAGPPAHQMFGFCYWDALNWNIWHIIRSNPDFQIWQPPA